MADNLYPIPYSETSSTTYTGYITQITLPDETKYEVIDEAGRKVLNEMSTTINSISGTLYKLRAWNDSNAVSTSYTPQGSITTTPNEGILIEFKTTGTVTIPIISSNSTIKNINNISLTIPNDNNLDYINYTPSGTISNTVSINSTVAVLTGITGVNAVVGLESFNGETDGITGTPIATIDENNPHRLKLNFIKPVTANTITSTTTTNVPSNIGVTSTFSGVPVYFVYNEITPANTEFTISSNGGINLKFEGTPATITSTPITMS